jgi:hypothetical protein
MPASPFDHDAAAREWLNDPQRTALPNLAINDALTVASLAAKFDEIERAAAEKATRVERERCAKEADYYAQNSFTAKNIAAAIRREP